MDMEIFFDGTEEWRPIEKFPPYEVSNLGRVRRRVPPRGEVKLLKPFTYGHSQAVELNGVRICIARAVVHAFFGAWPGRIYHRDGDGSNNSVVNLTLKRSKRPGKVYAPRPRYLGPVAKLVLSRMASTFMSLSAVCEAAGDADYHSVRFALKSLEAKRYVESRTVASRRKEYRVIKQYEHSD